MTKHPNPISDYESREDYQGREGLVYRRVSSKRQETDGNGLNSQEARCKNELHSLGVPYDRTFSDTYTGGGDFMMRPAMRELIAYIDANPHKRFVVIFDDLKRFARDTEFHLKLRTAFRKRDVLPRSPNFRFDETPEGRFVETVIAGQAELERHQNKRQVIQKMKARLEAGYWPFGFLKGYTMTKDPAHGKIAKMNKESGAIKFALEGFVNGTFVRKIDACRFLVEKGTWKDKPEKRIDMFDRMLVNIFYAGYIEFPLWGVTRRPGKHEALISLETYEAIQRRLGKNSITERVRVDISSDFPQRGITVCEGCQGHMTAAWSKGRNGKFGFYWCHNTSCPLYRKNARKDDVEREFDKLLKKTRLKDGVEKIIEAVFDRVWSEEVRTIEQKQMAANRRTDALREKIKQLTNLTISAKTDQSKRAYESQVEETAQELEGTENTLIENIDFSFPYRTALTKAIELLKNPSVAWYKLDIHEQRLLFYFLFEQKLAYSIKDGYRTAEIPTAARLFEEFVIENSVSVETGGFEPPCNDDTDEPSTSVV